MLLAHQLAVEAEDLYEREGPEWMHPNAETMARHYRETFLPLQVLHARRPGSVASLAETRGWVATDELGRREKDSKERWARAKLLGCQTACRRFGLSPAGHLKGLRSRLQTYETRPYLLGRGDLPLAHPPPTPLVPPPALQPPSPPALVAAATTTPAAAGRSLQQQQQQLPPPRATGVDAAGQRRGVRYPRGCTAAQRRAIDRHPDGVLAKHGLVGLPSSTWDCKDAAVRPITVVPIF